MDSYIVWTGEGSVVHSRSIFQGTVLALVWSNWGKTVPQPRLVPLNRSEATSALVNVVSWAQFLVRVMSWEFVVFPLPFMIFVTTSRSLFAVVTVEMLARMGEWSQDGVEQET
jgi:hypothetical protein